MRHLCVLLLVLGVAAIAPARDGLREILHPRAGLPAFRVLLPEGWTDTTDAAGNLRLANRDRSVTFALGFVPAERPAEALDPLARSLLQGTVTAPWDSRDAAEISGHRGHRYVARLRPAAGREVRTELVLVAVGDRHVASAALFLNDRAPAADTTLARLALAAVRIVPTP
jgi:hypothetical protein